ncbi:unnamed protein product [Auanema sp. JU1783]|nr:unnamed protein product [Auanema sp. JU1783]
MSKPPGSFYVHSGTLTSEQTKSLNDFIARTNVSSSSAKSLLSQCGWDLTSALKKYDIEGMRDENNEIKPSSSQVSVSDWMGRQLPGYAFCLPDLDRLAPDFRNFLEKDLIETPTQRRLETSKHLNWWSQFGEKLYPLSTTGDGNCLLHAASLGMWGLHDRQLTLREALYEMIIRGTRRSALWRRWKWSEHKSYSDIGLTLSEDEWMSEWNNNIVSLASPTPRKTDDASSDSTDQIYESLEAIHVFALAHVLKRPIIVVSDTVLRNAKGEELSPVPFGGVYLPLECPPIQCHRSPLVLCYDSAHFSPLVPMQHDSSLPQIIPITDVNRNLLPLHFAIDPGPDFTWWKDDEDARIATRLEMSDSDRLALISEYMDLIRLEVRRGSVRKTRPIRANSVSTTEKSLTLASSGVSSDNREKRRILNEIRQQFMRTLRLSSAKTKENGIDARLCASDLSRANCVIAARLYSASHEYMDEMIKEYMKTARERFQNSNNHVENGNNRKRISRSFSASSLLITCINKQCDKPASQSSNFLCRECFEHQKELMTSFSCEGNGKVTVGTPSPAPTFKSNTMPVLSSPPVPTPIPLAICPIPQAGEKVAPVLGVVTKGQTTTTTMTIIKGENGVTHYYVPDPESVDNHMKSGDHETHPICG